MMSINGRVFLVFCVVAAISITTEAQSSKTAASPAPVVSPANTSVPGTKAVDYSKEGVILEQLRTHMRFETDGRGSRETTAVYRVQAESGVQNLAVLTFPYTSEYETVELDYVRVRKPDGAVVNTPAYNIQNLPADVTRIAPMYSDIYKKHVAVRTPTPALTRPKSTLSTLCTKSRLNPRRPPTRTRY